MRNKAILAVLALTAAGSAGALTLEQSRGAVYAQCAGVYMAEASVAYRQNRMEDYSQAERYLEAASEAATVRIGDAKTTKIGESTVTRLLNLYHKNPVLGEDRIARERTPCAEYFE